MLVDRYVVCAVLATGHVPIWVEAIPETTILSVRLIVTATAVIAVFREMRNRAVKNARQCDQKDRNRTNTVFNCKQPSDHPNRQNCVSVIAQGKGHSDEKCLYCN